ncbi:YhcN/YlaJ family sporulation lipoprotein [Bacillus sp. 165]|uniref:YhcN/YlaJ family sporulation lipoprotein n=1 Tax=Bacillus sp. 165 TaxID=1529117 RepID=UPI001ADC9606|nr:YhcN/YlaJ family sporulation lipoprotein [Bacillus sp. 165]MBO9130485.1 YhcN/YlaJ family sporulation lipoprotein [Bacillus sp. 165]
MNKKIKVLTTSLLVFGALSACNVDNKTAMDRQMNTAYNYNHVGNFPANYSYDRVGYYSYNNYPNSYGYAPKPVNDFFANKYRTDDMYGMKKVRNNRPSNYSFERTGYYSYNYPNVNQYTNNSLNMSNVNNRIGKLPANYSYDRVGYYSFNNYPNAYGYAPKSVINRDNNNINIYGMKKSDVNLVKNDHNGDVRYSEINKRIHDNNNDADYHYYADRNFHGHLTDDNYGMRRVNWSNYSNGDGIIAEKISNRIEKMTNVDKASTVVYGDDILVAVKSNTANKDMVENEIRKAVEPYAKNRTVHVQVDETMYNKIKDLNNDLRYGKVSNGINKDLDNMFNSLRTKYNNMTR